MSNSTPYWSVYVALAAWPHADEQINVKCGVYMLRVVVALLLAAAVLTAVDLTGLVDFVYNRSSPLERLAPTYVFEVDGCKVLVYVVDSTLENSPIIAQMRDTASRYSRKETLRPLTSAEVEKLLNALFQALGPSVRAEVGVGTRFALWYDVQRYEVLHIEARNVTQLAEEARRAVEADFYLGAADAHEALLKKRAEQVAHLYLVEWRRGDLVVLFIQDTSSAELKVYTANFSAAVEALKKAREAAGEVWNSAEVWLDYGPYLISDDEAKNLTKAALMLEKEHEEVWEFIDEEGQVRRVWGTVDIFVGRVGPPYVIFPYPNGVVPEKATAERLVRRFVELSGFCKTPLVVEFWPGPELKPPPMERSPPLWPFAAVGAALAVAVGLLVLARRRR